MTAREGAAPGQAAVSPLEALALRMDKIAADHQAEAERPLSDGVKYRALAAQDRVWAKLLREAIAAAAAAQPAPGGDVHVDWHMTRGEWRQLYTDLWQHTDTPYIARLIEAGKIPAPPAGQPAPGNQLLSDHLRERGRPGVAAMIEAAEDEDCGCNCHGDTKSTIHGTCCQPPEQPAPGDAPFRRVLKEHFLMTVVCDPEKKQDNPVCQCSRVHLGWHPSIGAAVDAWINHVMEVLGGQPAPGDELAMLRADIADYEALLAKWPKCPAGCNCRVGIDTDPDANECGCDGPCNGGEQPAPAPAAAKLTEVLGWFTVSGTRCEASVTRAQLANAYAGGELTVPEELRRFL